MIFCSVFLQHITSYLTHFSRSLFIFVSYLDGKRMKACYTWLHSWIHTIIYKIHK